jgi:hypothetical protein
MTTTVSFCSGGNIVPQSPFDFCLHSKEHLSRITAMVIAVSLAMTRHYARSFLLRLGQHLNECPYPCDALYFLFACNFSKLRFFLVVGALFFSPFSPAFGFAGDSTTVA